MCHLQAQAWHIDHLDQKQRELNWKTIRGIAAIMHEFPFVVCHALTPQ